jgi:hypothetical protein
MVQESRANCPAEELPTKERLAREFYDYLQTRGGFGAGLLRASGQEGQEVVGVSYRISGNEVDTEFILPEEEDRTTWKYSLEVTVDEQPGPICDFPVPFEKVDVNWKEIFDNNNSILRETLKELTDSK